MGDPETQAVFPRINSDIVEVFMALANGTLKDVEFSISNKVCATIILASKGYPEEFEKGKVITHIEDVKDAYVFHAGTTLAAYLPRPCCEDESEAIKNGIVNKDAHNIISTGGRVLAVSALGKTIDEAVAIANKNAEIIQFENKYYRKDIGFDM